MYFAWYEFFRADPRDDGIAVTMPGTGAGGHNYLTDVLPLRSPQESSNAWAAAVTAPRGSTVAGDSQQGGSAAPSRRLAPPSTLLRGLQRDLSQVASVSGLSGGSGGISASGGSSFSPMSPSRVDTIAEVDEVAEMARILEESSQGEEVDAGPAAAATADSSAQLARAAADAAVCRDEAACSERMAAQRQGTEATLMATWPSITNDAAAVEATDLDVLQFIDTGLSPFTHTSTGEDLVDLLPPSPPLSPSSSSCQASLPVSEASNPLLVSGKAPQQLAEGQPPQGDGAGGSGGGSSSTSRGEGCGRTLRQPQAAQLISAVGGPTTGRIRRLSTRSRVHALLDTYPPGGNRLSSRAGALRGASPLGASPVERDGAPAQGGHAFAPAPAPSSAPRPDCYPASTAAGRGGGGGDGARLAEPGQVQAAAGVRPGGRWYQVRIRVVMPQAADRPHSMPLPNVITQDAAAGGDGSGGGAADTVMAVSEPLLVVTAYDVDEFVQAARALDAALAARDAQMERLETLLAHEHKLLESVFPRQAIEHMTRVIAAKSRVGAQQAPPPQGRATSSGALNVAAEGSAPSSAATSRNPTPPGGGLHRTSVPPEEGSAAMPTVREADGDGRDTGAPAGSANRRRSAEIPRSRNNLLPHGPVSRSDAEVLPPPLLLHPPRRSSQGLGGGAGTATGGAGDGSAAARDGGRDGGGWESTSLAGALPTGAAGVLPLADEGQGDEATAPSEPFGSQELAPALGAAQLATAHRHVTVLFADIVGFTSMCNELEPLQVMAFLNGLFTRFDSLCDIYGVYKVETIGDCFMVVGGLITVDEDGFKAVRQDGSEDELHAVKVMSFAKAMQREVHGITLPHNGEPLRLRVGLHSGPVTSGIVGSKMPRFCLFGDTVNTASRMESTCEPGAIHASAATAALLPDEAWAPTGGVQVKGKGEMQARQ
ncbi:hypothetical protein GPECTOR_62g893 [Gonium pectorale]|uniref:Guanylate cyclase domain-containing protein n=1 Tax=Gonium pectorale TaxID=33097 RepID=A0A150G4N1_GONPE|nr:hypothetical protein GPECTOR_62g893 [Gonium pectorale]|eukprot:KXZ44778.1 hypothetical protein GPECTOR_62g893 [Gonium pectorale]